MQVLIIGLGSIGERHLRHLREHEDSHNVVAYRSGTSDDFGEYEDVTEYRDFDKCLSTSPDFAIISNPTHKHVETALRCAREGCHLLVEKPLSHTTEGISELVKVVENKDLITMIGCNLRFHPVIKHIKDLIESNRIEEIYYYRAYSGSYLPDWRPAQDYRDVYSAKRAEGGGVVLDMIHELDYSIWLFGRPTQVSGTVQNISHLEIETEDIAEIHMEMENGCVGSVHVDYIRRTPRRELEIITKHGIIEANLLSSTVDYETEDKNITWEFNVDIDETYTEQLDYFISQIKNGKKCQNDIRKGYEVLEVALRAKEGF